MRERTREGGVLSVQLHPHAWEPSLAIRRRVSQLLVFSSLLASATAAADEGPEHVTAQRTTSTVVLDGRLDEEAWRHAPVFSRFIESFPKPGAVPTFRTEVRVLYDAEFLYVGVMCF